MLRLRAAVLKAMRTFLDERDSLEVVTPVLGRTGVPDVHIDSIVLQAAGEPRYLQTSPEYFMKRLLAAGSGPIYQIGPLFRAGEQGPRHNTEFVMLEWYRPGLSLHALGRETEALLQAAAGAAGRDMPAVDVFTYQALFESRYGINPHAATTGELRKMAEDCYPGFTAHIRDLDDTGTHNDYLDLLFSRGIEGSLANVAFVYDYPEQQAALARIKPDDAGNTVARRFECFIDGVEIANAYDELTDGEELRTRLALHNQLRRARDKPPVPLDENLLAASDAMPDSAGIALGVDRLVQWLAGATTLDAVLPFGDGRL
ncbi:MAG: EF-P lysine aminoacylase EpmA [Gammaproteobacteria bacterium]|nr:EF-P lysine aminoacylase EpmA [Gammaproteobacteria bacterium]